MALPCIQSFLILQWCILRGQRQCLWSPRRSCPWRHHQGQTWGPQGYPSKFSDGRWWHLSMLSAADKPLTRRTQVWWYLYTGYEDTFIICRDTNYFSRPSQRQYRKWCREGNKLANVRKISKYMCVFYTEETSLLDLVVGKQVRTLPWISK